MNLPDIEIVSAEVHEAWMALKRDAGVTSRKLDTTGEELMVPYAQLSEQAKELDRGTVRTVYAAIERIAAGATAVDSPQQHESPEKFVSKADIERAHAVGAMEACELSDGDIEALYMQYCPDDSLTAAISFARAVLSVVGVGEVPRG